MEAPAAIPVAAVTLQLAGEDAAELAALLDLADKLRNELRHARDTHFRRGDDASLDRVLDLECQASCHAMRIAKATARVFAGKLTARGEVTP